MFKNIFSDLFSSKEEITSISTEQFNSSMQRHKFSDFLAYSLYDDVEKIYYNNDGSFGAILLLQPRIKAGSETSYCIQEIINKLTADMFLQISIIGSKNIYYLVEKYKQDHSIRAEIEEDAEKKKMYQYCVDMMSEWLREKMQDNLASNVNSAVKENYLLFSIKASSKENVLMVKKSIKNILEANLFKPQDLSAHMLKFILFEVLNPSHDLKDIPAYDITKAINRQLINSDTVIHIKDSCLHIDKQCVACLSPVVYPDKAHIIDFGEKLGNTIGKTVNDNQLPDRFIVTASIAPLSERKTKAAKNSHAMILSQKWSETLFRHYNQVKEESLSILDRVDKNQEKLFAFDLNVCIYGEDEETVFKNVEVVKKIFKSGNSRIVLNNTDSIHQLAFLNSLPMNINEEYMFELACKYNSFFPDQISCFVPLESDWQGVNMNVPLFTRRNTLAGFDLFDSNTNYNGFLVAGSGAGKSVLLNMIVFNSFMRGDKVFILDYDNSFTNTVLALHGQYLALNIEKPISFNPFTHLKEYDADDFTYIEELIYMLGSSKNNSKASEDEKFIKSCINAALLQSYQDYGTQTEITHIRDRLKALYQNDIRIQDFCASMNRYCIGGVYEKFFSGECEFNISNDLISVEFKGIDAHADLRDPLIMLLTYHIGQMMYQNKNKTREVRIQIIYDEAHQFLGKNPRMDTFIDQGYRRARKYNASLMLATQGFGDIYNATSGGLSPAGACIVNNSSWKIFMKQTEPSISMLLQSELFSLNDIEIQNLKDAHTSKGNYSEFMIITPDEFKIPVRLILPKFFYYLTSTAPNDRKALSEIMQNNNCDIYEAIGILVKKEKTNKKDVV